MHKQWIPAAALMALCLPAVSSAQSVTEILDTARAMQQLRWEGLDAYVVERTTMGQTVSLWHVRAPVDVDGGATESMFVPMGAQQLRAKLCKSDAMSAEGLDAYADASEWTGDVLSSEIGKGMDDAGIPSSMLNATGDKPWSTMNPRVMMGGNAAFLREAARVQRENEAYDPSVDAQQNYDQMTDFAKKARLVGRESVDGRPAFHIRATDVDQVHQGEDGSEFRIDTIDLLIDSEHYVPLSMKMQGEIEQDGETRPMTMENLQTDYRNVAGSDLYESFRQVTKMSGMLSPEQQAEVQEAQAGLADYERQLKAMDDNQRAMVEAMMGDKIEQFRKMASGNSFEIEMKVKNIRPVARLTHAELGCDENPFSRVEGGSGGGMPGMPMAAAAPQAAPPAAQAGGGGPPPVPARAGNAPSAVAAPAASGDAGVTQMVQQNLVALGYDTGNTSGELSTATVVAISQFQAENGMQVTGQPSPQLAGILAAKANAKANPPQRSPEELQAARQACLQEKMAAAQAAQKKKRGLGRLLSGVSRIAGQSGNYDLSRKTHDIYQAGATAEDFSQAAKDLGLTEDDVEACQNPG